jgi:hypothetical protein
VTVLDVGVSTISPVSAVGVVRTSELDGVVDSPVDERPSAKERPSVNERPDV